MAGAAAVKSDDPGRTLPGPLARLAAPIWRDADAHVCQRGADSVESGYCAHRELVGQCPKVAVAGGFAGVVEYVGWDVDRLSVARG
jgi:hypothetical protein